MENENNQRKKLVEKEIFPFLAKKTILPHRPKPRSFKTNGPFHLKEQPVSCIVMIHITVILMQ